MLLAGWPLLGARRIPGSAGSSLPSTPGLPRRVVPALVRSRGVAVPS